MKTNRFDEILRRKLESIKPDFQDQDWKKWQAFRQHATPTFWQTYGHWLGYAVATLTTAVMVVLYVNQSNQNEDLLKEMQTLKQQITEQTQADRLALDSASTGGVPPTEKSYNGSNLPHSDTVYIVERRTVYVDRPSQAEANPENTPNTIEAGKIPALPEADDIVKNQPKQSNRLTPGETPSSFETEEPARSNTPVSAKEYRIGTQTETNLPAANNAQRSENHKTQIGEITPQGTLPSFGAKPEMKAPITGDKGYGSERLDLGEIVALPTPTYNRPATTAYRRLQSRMPQPARTPDPRLAQAKVPAVVNQKLEVPSSVQKVEKMAKDERLLPDFRLGLPYRVGVGQQWSGVTKASGFWNEVLLGKHWSVQAGLSFQKLEDQKFYNDRIFRERTHEDFRKVHAKPLPPSFDIFNITISTTLTQIPFNLTYRGDLGHNFAYFAGVGTNLNLRAKQTLSFDFKLPTNDFGEQRAQRTIPFPLINTMNLLVGAEKRWSPIVLQANLFLDNRLKTFPSLDDRTSLGLQVKILYEMGAVKKR